MQRSDYPNAADYGYALGYHLAATNTLSDLNEIEHDCPSHELPAFFRGLMLGADDYHCTTKH